MNIGVVGNGFVGQAMTLLRPGINVNVWDIEPSKCEPQGLGFRKFVDISEIIFVAVPTPMNSNGTCHLDIVESVIHKIKAYNSETPIVIRSTVPPGTCTKLGVSFMPEFLTEKHWKQDFKSCRQWIIGTTDTNLVTRIQQMFKLACDAGCIENPHVIHMKETEAEMVKYVKNCFLATKVSFFNEIDTLCKAVGIDYTCVREVACDDPRIGHGHTSVPGHDKLRGYGGTCFPKDMNAILKYMEHLGVASHVIAGAITRNETIDRPGKDWMKDKGRAAI